MAYAYRYKDLIEALASVGVGCGDKLFIHSNIGFFGKAEGVEDADALARFFLNALKETVGENGTIVCPSFTYSFCHNEIFDPKATATKCGMLPEYMRREPDVVRSLDPNFSIVAWGKDALMFTEVRTHESFGEGSFWERLLDTPQSRILCMNFDCGSTFVHYVEKKANVPYRYNKAFNGIMQVDGQETRDYFVHWVYDMEKPEDAAYMGRLTEFCKAEGICRTAGLGRGIMNCMDTKIYYEFINDKLNKYPRFLTVGGDGTEWK